MRDLRPPAPPRAGGPPPPAAAGGGSPSGALGMSQSELLAMLFDPTDGLAAGADGTNGHAVLSQVADASPAAVAGGRGGDLLLSSNGAALGRGRAEAVCPDSDQCCGRGSRSRGRAGATRGG